MASTLLNTKNCSIKKNNQAFILPFPVQTTLRDNQQMENLRQPHTSLDVMMKVHTTTYKIFLLKKLLNLNPFNSLTLITSFQEILRTWEIR